LIGRLDAGTAAGLLQQGTWDLCIVGAGAAGLALAAEFLDTPWRVLVLESGTEAPDSNSNELNSLECVGVPHDGWRDGRVRAFGGTTRAWGGQLVPMRASELAARPWVPYSGWPLDLDELQPYYRRVEKVLRVEGPPYDAAVWAHLGMTAPAFPTDELLVRFSQWAALGRRNFALLWRKQLRTSTNVTVLLDATAIAVRCGLDGAHCERVEIRSSGGVNGAVRAKSFVLATGGIETARLLLASAREAPPIANSSGLVGRCFQDHISYIAGELEPASRKTVQHLFDPRYIGSTMYSVKLEPPDATMRSRGWLNAMAHLAFEIPDALGWMEIRRLLRSVQAGRLELPTVRETWEMMRAGSDLLRLILARTWAKRRRSPDSGVIRLLVDTEQAPNPESRITLVDAVDSMGMPRARLDWRITDLEYRTLQEFACHVAGQFEKLGLGRVRLAGQPDLSRRQELGAARDIFHHMGTARMSRDPREGVTRPDLRCHDVDNLYIAGPAVFPTGGIANPTFTALALTVRLADRLKAVNPVQSG
jgi:choline dehydrogenase-like flavoprotein